jgi:hypothetical protein
MMARKNLVLECGRLCLAVLLATEAGVVMGQQPILPTAPVASGAAERVGAEWELLVRKGEVTAVTSRMDLRLLAEKALAGLPGEEQERQEFVSQYAKGATASIQHVLKGFTTYRFLGVVRTNGAGGLVFRGLLPDGAVNYHRYLIEPKSGGEVAVTDVFVVSQGEWLSSTIRWLYLLSEGKRGPGAAAKLQGAPAELVRQAATVERLLGFMQQRKYLEFVDAYRGLPETLKEDRTLLQMELVASLAVEPLEFGLASKAWAKRYPGDPGLDLVTFEKLAVRGEHERSAAALERIEQFIGNDLHLRALRGAQLARAGQVAIGRQLAMEAVRAEPELATGYDALLGIAIRAKEFKEIARILDLVSDHLPVDPREIVQTQPQYVEFLAAPEGRTWLAKKPDVRAIRQAPLTNAPAPGVARP